MGVTKILSDNGTQAAKAIALAVALESALANADFLIKKLRQFPFLMTDGQLKQLDVLTKHITKMTDAASLVSDYFYKVIAEGG